MKVQDLELPGLKLIDLRVYPDERGFFVERFHHARFKELGLPFQFVQDNFSRSAPGVLRGLHYQFDPPQAKLVTCLSGRILDVVVDLRAGSPSLGQSFSIELSGDHPQCLWVPVGFAHGFLALNAGPADVLYKVDSHYSAAGESGLAWNDPDLGIQWPETAPKMSAKDQDLPLLSNYLESPRFQFSGH